MRPATDYLRAATVPLTLATVGSTDITLHRPLGSREFHIFGALSATNQPVEDAVPVPDPALWFVTMLREELAREGIRVRGKARSVGWPSRSVVDTSEMRELGFIESRPMRELVARMVKPSQNLYAQLLLLQAGARRAEPHHSTEDLGIRALRDFLVTAGISRDEVLLEEGSGLSRSCLVTPGATVQLLAHMAKHPHAEIFAECLPEPGGEGTLRRRLTDLKGRVRAKTGTLRYVNSLSGYATTAAGQRVAFSIMLNAYNPAPGAREPRSEIDEIVRLVCSLREP
jgi:D-alanyl-D-alanine carboxypeptidase/D-alanyl-D-alanine-endopeptidase (penicillin-binding protein 4)